MEHTFTFTDDELYTLRYSISQRIYRVESLLEEAKVCTPCHTVKIGNLSECLSNLNSIFDKISKGGE